MRNSWFIPLLVLLIAAPTAHADTTLVRPDGTVRTGTLAQWVHESKIPTPNTVLTFVRGDCPGAAADVAACVNVTTKTMYLGNGPYPRTNMLHELGHVLDWGMPSSEHAVFARLMNDTRAWDEGDPRGNPPLREKFADFYGACADGPVNPYATWFGYWGYTVRMRGSKFNRYCRHLASVPFTDFPATQP